MTKREFYTAIEENESLPMEQREMAAALKGKLDETNAKRAAKPSKASIANAPMIDAVVAMLTAEPQTATTLLPAMAAAFPAAEGEKPMTVQKVSHLLVDAVKAGRCHSVDVKIKGKGTQKGYYIEG